MLFLLLKSGKSVQSWFDVLVIVPIDGRSVYPDVSHDYEYVVVDAMLLLYAAFWHQNAAKYVLYQSSSDRDLLFRCR